MDYIAIARKLREIIVSASKNLTDDEAAEIPFAFDKWEVDKTYATGDRIRFREKLYKVLQDHISQSAWTPDVTPSLYAEVLPGQDGEIGEWVQPDSTNPYMTGDKVTHNGQTWISTIDNNVWEPGVYGWEVI